MNDGDVRDWLIASLQDAVLSATVAQWRASCGYATGSLGGCTHGDQSGSAPETKVETRTETRMVAYAAQGLASQAPSMPARRFGGVVRSGPLMRFARKAALSQFGKLRPVGCLGCPTLE